VSCICIRTDGIRYWLCDRADPHPDDRERGREGHRWVEVDEDRFAQAVMRWKQTASV
jgi:hypothetical protein